MRPQSITYLLLLVLLLSQCNNKRTKPATLLPNQTVAVQKTISLFPYQGFDTSLLATLQQQVAQFYHCPVNQLPSEPLPSFAFYAPRQRYKADSLLVYQNNKAGNHFIVGLTHQDISTSKDKNPDWGVFGLGYCPGNTCVISIWRLKRASHSRQQLQERLLKVVLHELGHNLGLPHCSGNPECLLNDAGGTIVQVDREKLWLCEQCRKLLK